MSILPFDECRHAFVKVHIRSYHVRAIKVRGL